MTTLSTRKMVSKGVPTLPFTAIAEKALPGWDISLVFVGTARATSLNKALRKKTYAPNVLSYETGKKSGEIIILQKKVGGSLGQVFISPFPPEKQLTAELIAQEFPEKKIVKGKKVLIGGVEAFSFESELEGTGPTWEIIFANNGYIYQCMSVLADRENFEEILTTWEF